MDDLGLRLVYHAVTCLAHLKCQVGVLAVGRCKPGIKAADLVPQLVGKQDRCTGNVVHVLDVVVLRLIRIIQTAIIPAGTIAPDDAACFLQTSIRVNQLGAYHSDGRVRLNELNQGRKPVFGHLGIVV